MRNKSKSCEGSKSKICLAGSEDSGASLLCTNQLQMLENGDSKTKHEKDQIMDCNLRVTRSMDRGRQYIAQISSTAVLGSNDQETSSTSEGPISEKSHFSFQEEDDLSLDYEPSEYEMEDFNNSPTNVSVSSEASEFLDTVQKNSAPHEDGTVCDSQTKRMSPKDMQRTIYHQCSVGLASDDISVPKSSDIENHYEGCGEPSSSSCQQPNQDNWSEYGNHDEGDDVYDYDLNQENYVEGDEVMSEYVDNLYENEEDTLSSKLHGDLFKNACFGLKGLNITITRPVINNTVKDVNSSEEKPISGLNSQKVSESASSSEKITKKFRLRRFFPDIENSYAFNRNLQKRKWPYTTTNSYVLKGVFKITSGDDIFSYNVRSTYNSSMQKFFSYPYSSCKVSPDYIGDVFETDSERSEYSQDDNSSVNENYFIPIRNKCTTASVASSEVQKDCQCPENLEYNSETTPPKLYKQNRPNTYSDESKKSSHSLTSFKSNSNNAPRSDTPLEEDEISIYGSSSILDVEPEVIERISIDSGRNLHDKEEFVTRWLMHNNEDVHRLLGSLCESQLRGGCSDIRCTRSHSIEEVERKISLLPIHELFEVYKLTLKNIGWFKRFFATFLLSFNVSANRGKIIDMIGDVSDVFGGTFIDKTDYIYKIIEMLRRGGLSFKEVIHGIIVKYGTSHTWISDILLLIISKEPNLEEHWYLVTKVICGRKDQIDHEVVNNLLTVALGEYPPKIELCRKIMNEIFDRNLADFSKISPSFINCIRMILKPSTATNSSDNPTLANYMVSNSSSSSDTTSTVVLSEFNKSLELMRCRNFGANSCVSLQQTYYDPSSPGSINLERGNYLFDRPTKIKRSDSDCSFNTGSSGIDGIHRVFNPFLKDITSPDIDEISDSINRETFLGRSDTAINHPNSAHDMRNNSPNIHMPFLNMSPKCSPRDSHDDVFKLPVNRAPKRPRDTCTKTKMDQNQSRPVYNNEVLNKINLSLHLVERPQTPANIVAHPTRQLTINSRFECNSSLHNLFPDVQLTATNMSMEDLRLLKEAINNLDGNMFLNILQSNCDSYTIENFILNTLTLLKSNTVVSRVFEKFMSLLGALGTVHPDYMKVPHIKGIIEVLAMNLIFFLETRCEWKLCRNILLKVKDWHSLLTSKIFFCESHVISHMNRYIYIIRILIHAEDFHWVNEIFQLEVLNLLKPVSHWPYQHVAGDVTVRNTALRLFFQNGFTLNVIAINDLLKHIAIVLEGRVASFDVWKLFDSQIHTMLKDPDKNRSILKLFFRDIVSHYWNFMEYESLQDYFLYMKDKVPEQEAFSLFKVCCRKGIYHAYTGRESLVLIKTTLSDFEIKSIIKCFFENIINKHVYPHDFCIEVKLPDTEQSTRLQKPGSGECRSVFAVFADIVQALKVYFNIIINQPVQSKIWVSQKMQEPLLLWR